MLTRKHIIAAIGLALVPIIGYFIAKTKNRNKNKQLQDKLFIGIELGGTNYNVAIAQPVTNQQGNIIDFKILKRKNGNTYLDPTKSLD